MNATLLALAMMAQPEAQAGKVQFQRIAKAIIPVAQQYKLDPTLMAAIAIAETGGRNMVAYQRGRHRKGADVGVFQIHCRRARPRCIKRYLSVTQSATEAANILTLGRRICQKPSPGYKRVCSRGFWARYNPGSARWAKRVKALWSQIADHIQRHTGA